MTLIVMRMILTVCFLSVSVVSVAIVRVLQSIFQLKRVATLNPSKKIIMKMNKFHGRDNNRKPQRRKVIAGRGLEVTG